MLTKTVTIAPDGSLVVTKRDDGQPSGATVTASAHSGGHGSGVIASTFIGGFLVGMLVLWLLQWQRRTRHRAAMVVSGATDREAEARMAADVAALARRTATLETIVTDPGLRTAREIDALR